MLMMLLDLLAEDVPKHIATAFYSEIRCLSRSNLVFDIRTGTWVVCFMNDYSQAVGELLAKYVDATIVSAITREVSEDIMSTSAHLMSHSTFFQDLLKQLNLGQSVRRGSIEDSCCRACFSSRYFAHLSHGVCGTNPFGRNCCHNICKSLSRLRIGMSHSVGFCCPRLYPQYCVL